MLFVFCTMPYQSEDDTRARYIDPALKEAGWDDMSQVQRNFAITAGRIMVKGKLTARGKKKYADYALSIIPNNVIAIIEAKHFGKRLGTGMQQGLEYAEMLDVPFVFSTNGQGFLFHDKTNPEQLEKELRPDEFPSPEELLAKYNRWKEIGDTNQQAIVQQPFYTDGSGKSPRYYQQIAIRRSLEAVAKQQERIILVMATGTGKTFTAFQIIWRLWKSGAKKRILFLADRTVLAEQTIRDDFSPFGEAMTYIQKKKIEKAYSVYVALYQGLTDHEGEDPYKQFSPDFFDLIVVDECHRGSARDDSQWREILTYFSSATHLGLTATPKETKEVSNSEYFGDPIYTYSLRQGIDDGFLAPYKVIKLALDIDVDGWRPPDGFLDKDGQPVEDRIYDRTDFDKRIAVKERRELVAKKITEWLQANDPYAKSIIFCVDIEHAEAMRSAMVNANPSLVQENRKYVMQITGDNDEGKKELDNFQNPSERYPVIATTSKLLNTGVNVQTCKLIVLDSNIRSMTEFKQIIGRGTRVKEEFGKSYFTILDFRNVTSLFADPEFDGDPIVVKEQKQDDDMSGVENDSESTIVDPITGEEIHFPNEYSIPGQENQVKEPRRKIHVKGVEVTVLKERIQFLDQHGKLVTEDLRDYTRKNVLRNFDSLESFLRRWSSAEKKRVLVEELQEEGIFFEALQDEVGKEFDPFDLICHVAFDAPPLTRKERANNVRKRHYFAKYGDKAQLVLNSLLEKYADDGLLELEKGEILRMAPFTDLGTPVELVKAFGGKAAYQEALVELETELYKTA